MMITVLCMHAVKRKLQSLLHQRPMSIDELQALLDYPPRQYPLPRDPSDPADAGIPDKVTDDW